MRQLQPRRLEAQEEVPAATSQQHVSRKDEREQLCGVLCQCAMQYFLSLPSLSWTLAMTNPTSTKAKPSRYSGEKVE
jgi:hypothetical protein